MILFLLTNSSWNSYLNSKKVRQWDLKLKKSIIRIRRKKKLLTVVWVFYSFYSRKIV